MRAWAAVAALVGILIFGFDSFPTVGGLNVSPTETRFPLRSAAVNVGQSPQAIEVIFVREKVEKKLTIRNESGIGRK